MCEEYKTIDFGNGKTICLSDEDNSIENFENYIGDIGWRYEDSAVRKIFNKNILAKADISAVLRNHPNYVEKLKGVLIGGDYTRNVNETVAHQFYTWLCRKMRSIALEKGWDEYVITDVVYYLAYDCTQTMTSEYSCHRLEEIFTEHEEFGLQKLHVHYGQKRSKLVGKFCRMLGIDKDENYSKIFAKYGDAINPMKVKLPTLITTNANDFVRMSDGAGERPWRSCHNPDKSAYSGCNCSGGISHALDNTSIIMYTVSDNCNGEYQTARKIDRCVFFAGRNSDGEIEWFVQSKVYPDGTQQKSNEFRELFQRVWSECTGKPNLWTKGEMGDDWARIWLSESATLYPDFEYCDRNIIVPFYPSGENTERFQPILAGEAPICVECGSTHYIRDEINCCHFFQGGWECPNCGESWDDEDDGYVYSNFHNEVGCTSCMSWSSIAEDYFYDSEEWVYVENIRENVPVSYMEDNWTSFAKCSECDSWIYIGDVRYSSGFYMDADGDYYCNNCGETVLSYCEDCGEYYRTDDMVEIDGEYYCESCAEAHKEKAEKISEVA